MASAHLELFFFGGQIQNDIIQAYFTYWDYYFYMDIS